MRNMAMRRSSRRAVDCTIAQEKAVPILHTCTNTIDLSRSTLPYPCSVPLSPKLTEHPTDSNARTRAQSSTKMRVVTTKVCSWNARNACMLYYWYEVDHFLVLPT